jgi:hypothetical protein
VKASPEDLSAFDFALHELGAVALYSIVGFCFLQFIQWVMTVRMCYKVGKEKLLSEAEHDPD